MALQSLELKIPPVMVTLIVAALMWLTDLLLPGTALVGPVRWAAIAALLVAGGGIAVVAVVAFHKAQTTVNPLAPDECSTLVTTGVFQLSRNPMYLGLLFALIAWGVYLSNLYSIVLSAAFPVYMNIFQILPEERALLSAYGEAYREYMQRVRRWL